MNNLSSQLDELRSEINQLNKEILKITDREHQSQLNEALVEQKLKSVQDLIGRELECPICTELFIQPATTACRHTFCAWCIFRVIRRKSDCPLCNKRITRLHRSDALENMVTKFIQYLAPDELDYRRKEEEDRKSNQLMACEWEKWFPEDVRKILGSNVTSRGRGRGNRRRGRRGGRVTST